MSVEDQSIALRRLPYHPSIPPVNVFAGKDCRTAERVTTVLENFILTGIRKAQHFQPTKDDVILVSGPRCGEEMLGRILAGLVAKEPAVLAQREDNWTVPWIESRYADEAPSDLSKFHFSQTRRVLRTQMSMTMLNPRQHKGPKYIVSIRHPLDMRAEFFKYLWGCYKIPCEDPPRTSFDELFPAPDSFVNIPVTLCQMSTIDPASYEQFVSDWYRESRQNADVLLVFYESLVSNPRREINRISSFLNGQNVRLDDARDIARRKKESAPAFQPSTGEIDEQHLVALLAIGRLTDKSQRDASSARRMVNTLKRMSMAIKRKARSTSKRSGSSSSGSRGSFYNEGDGGEGMGGSNYETALATRQVQLFWEQRVGLTPATYEMMYESDMNEAYPFPQVSIPRDPAPVPSASPLQSSLDAAGKVMRVAKARFTTVMRSDIAEKVLSPVSALKTSRFRPNNNSGDAKNGDEGTSAEGQGRDYAGSMLPAQAFAGQDWITSTSLSNHNDNNIPEGQDESFSEASDITQQASLQSGAEAANQPLATKFATQQVMEANMLRSSMRLAGVDKAKIDVVAVKSEELSEML